MKKLNKEDVTTIVIHCSATKLSQDINAEDIRRWHTEERKWSDIGYHYVIKRDGTVETGRSKDYQGAHVKGHNHYTLGVCLIGGLNESGKEDSNFTFAQFEGLAHLVRLLKITYPINKIVGHRDLLKDKSKACPCFDAEALAL